METIWIGWDIIAGIVIVLLVAIASGVVLARRGWKKIRTNRFSAKLVDAGFTWEYRLHGWLSRDPYTDDWILWDERNEQMLRLPRQGDDWQASEENFQQCIELGQKYRVRLRGSV